LGQQGENRVVTSGHHAPRTAFIIPVPGKNGNSDSSSLAGKTFVLTGVFPEVGGGSGLSLGKDKVKRMVTSFGGRVTGSVSGKTNYLIVGKQPGKIFFIFFWTVCFAQDRNRWCCLLFDVVGGV
tara:strand:- start:334 stop:705 length:372 start_codon:yes stop_codon:yes gene_type:complete